MDPGDEKLRSVQGSLNGLFVEEAAVAATASSAGSSADSSGLFCVPSPGSDGLLLLFLFCQRKIFSEQQFVSFVNSFHSVLHENPIPMRGR